MTTEKFFHLHDVHPDKKRRLDDAVVSAIGMGTYIGDCDDRTDHLFEKSILTAVSHGVNFIDTANSYRCQRSEKVIGKVVRELESNRDQLFISTKGGYLPCDDNIDQFQAYIRTHYLEKGIIQPNEIVGECHCLSPRFLEHEIEKSLRHMHLSYIDLYYLHNPETQLAEITENEFDERIYKAFELLEAKVRENKIKRYGLATWNGFRLKSSSKTHLNLPKLYGFAKKIAGEKHHFKAIMLPYNLVMLEALKVPILASAKECNLSVIASAPLMQSQILNLPRRIFDSMPTSTTAMQKALQFVLSTPNITAAMVGMKTAAHVHENLKVMQEPNWSEKEMKQALHLLGIKEEN